MEGDGGGGRKKKEVPSSLDLPYMERVSFLSGFSYSSVSQQ